MFFVAIGVVFAAPHLLNLGNRVIEEVIIPKLEIKNLRRRRAQQEAAGIPEKQREVFHHLPLHLLDIELTTEEFKEFKENGVLDVLKRAGNRRPHAKRMDLQ